MAPTRYKTFSILLVMAGLTVLVVSAYLSIKIGMRPVYAGFKTTKKPISLKKPLIRVLGGNVRQKKITRESTPPGTKPRSYNFPRGIIRVEGGMQSRRSLTLRMACERLATNDTNTRKTPTGNELFSNLVYKNKSDGFLFCDYMQGMPGDVTQLYEIVKAAKSSSDRKFELISNTLDDSAFRNLSMSCLERYMLLRDSVKVLFVKEPYSRLLYIYLQTFFITYRGKSDMVNNTIFKAYGSRCSPSVSFTDFLQLFLDSHRVSPGKVTFTNGPLTITWNSVFHSCSPCDIEYDFVGKLDHLDVELKDMFHVKHINGFANIKETVSMWERQLAQRLVQAVTDKLFQDCISLRHALGNVWKALQLMGILPNEKPLVLDGIESDQLTKRFMGQIDSLKQISQSVDSHDKNELVRQAYQPVPKHVLKELKESLRVEFSMFGYDPEFLRNRNKANAIRRPDCKVCLL